MLLTKINCLISRFTFQIPSNACTKVQWEIHITNKWHSTSQNCFQLKVTMWYNNNKRKHELGASIIFEMFGNTLTASMIVSHQDHLFQSTLSRWQMSLSHQIYCFFASYSIKFTSSIVCPSPTSLRLKLA